MRVIELSNHPGDMLNTAALRRQTAETKARSTYEHALIQHQARVQTARVKRDRARQRRQWWAWLRLAFGVWAEKRRKPRPPSLSASTELTDTEEKIRAGIAGEQLVAAELGRALTDDWTLLRGYRNRRGEIDHLLLGPKGLFAIEVKNVNATVYVAGDRWDADKYDNYGNLVERYQITDRKGRSPSEQLNEPADELERFLRERGQQIRAQRIVVLTHRRSRLASASHPTVHVGTSTGYVLTLLDNSPGELDELDERQRTELQRLIERDHDFHERTRRPGPAGPARSGRPRRTPKTPK